MAKVQEVLEAAIISGGCHSVGAPVIITKIGPELMSPGLGARPLPQIPVKLGENDAGRRNRLPFRSPIDQTGWRPASIGHPLGFGRKREWNACKRIPGRRLRERNDQRLILSTISSGGPLLEPPQSSLDALVPLWNHFLFFMGFLAFAQTAKSGFSALADGQGAAKLTARLR